LPHFKELSSINQNLTVTPIMIDKEYMTGLNNIRRNASFAPSIQIFRGLMEEASPRGTTSSPGVFLKSRAAERLGCSFHHRF
jgi:hypothetical protein